MEPDATKSVDPGTQAALETARAIAASKRPLLIAGEAGSGRATMARYLHRNVAPGSAFVPLDCEDVDSLPSWDADSTATVFFNEIGYLRRDLQSQLSDRLEAGGTAIRVFASSSPVGARACQPRGALVPELAELLQPSTVTIPSLRDRAADIPMLVETFLDDGESGEGVRVADAAMAYLSEYDWPGNVSELKQLTARFRERALGRVVTVDDLPPQIRWFPGIGSGCGARSKGEIGFNPLAEEFQYQLIADALRRTRQR